MTSIQHARSAGWWALSALLFLAAGSTVAIASDGRSRDTGHSSQRSSTAHQPQAIRTNWRESARQQRRDSTRNSQRPRASQDWRRPSRPPQASQNRQTPAPPQQSRRDAGGLTSGHSKHQRRESNTSDQNNRRDRRDRRDGNGRDGARQNERDRRTGWPDRSDRRQQDNRGNRDERNRSWRSQRQHASQDHRRRDHHRRRHHRPGHKVKVLPSRHSHFVWNRHSYFYGGGHFYRPSSFGYVVVGAPLGYRLSALPWGYATFYIAANRYHYVNDTYYRWYPDRRDYEVVAEPDGATDALYQASEIAISPLYVYPTQGQSEDQRDQDRYECHIWAVEESGFDPSYSEPDKQANDNYRRAVTACLQGRGYTVQ